MVKKQNIRTGNNEKIKTFNEALGIISFKKEAISWVAGTKTTIKTI